MRKMKDLSKWLTKFKGKNMLLVFPHPDDEAYVSGGLLQIAQKLSIKTKLICLTKGGRGILPTNKVEAKNLKDLREKELKSACSILGVDEMILWDYPDANLIKVKNNWIKILKQEINKSNASIVVTFDYSGITGHPDHLVVSKEVFEYLKGIKAKPELLLRVPDEQELKYFKENKAINFAQKPTHKLEYSISVSLNKIKAIFAHKSQLTSKLFALQILEWFLFDHKELYHLVDYKIKYPINLTFK